MKAGKRIVTGDETWIQLYDPELGEDAYSRINLNYDL